VPAAFTVVPPRRSSSALTNAMPANPVSVEPIASLMKTFGSAAVHASLTAGENSAAVELSETSEDVS
jgi:hypothetical protein